MAKLDIARLRAQDESMTTTHQQMLTLWQTLADLMYVERSDFLGPIRPGAELVSHLTDSTPIRARRSLGNMLNAMLRDGDWFRLTANVANLNRMSLMWLESKTFELKRLMDSVSSGFSRATTTGDHDFITFGNAVISCEINRDRTGLLFRAWHLRDVKWWCDHAGNVEGVHRKFTFTVSQLVREFGADKLHHSVVKLYDDRKYNQPVNCMHVFMPNDLYGMDDRRKWASVFVDMDHNHIIEEVGVDHQMYVIPRFQLVGELPYAYSPAAITALPDAGTVEAMQFTLLEAGERYTRPPIIATEKAIRGDVDLSSNGVTWVDAAYDERLGASLRPLYQNASGFPIGLEMQQDVRRAIEAAFFLDKLRLPDTSGTMTAYEVQERMKQYRRDALPLFGPIETEYNGQLCELAFSVALANNLLGSVYDIPDQLQGTNVRFEFTSPLNDAENEKRVNQFANVIDMVNRVAALDQNVAQNVQFDSALRDAVVGTGAPASWLVDEESVVEQRIAMAQQQQEMMQTMAQQQQGGE